MKVLVLESAVSGVIAKVLKDFDGTEVEVVKELPQLEQPPRIMAPILKMGLRMTAINSMGLSGPTKNRIKSMVGRRGR